tara:strand:+ start:1390 stop:1641 length:252 start_codon:yes stop_codon:yes gene_type:complete
MSLDELPANCDALIRVGYICHLTICDATNAENKNNSAIWQKIVLESKACLVRNIFISTKGIVWECDPIDKNTSFLLTKRKSNY